MMEAAETSVHDRAALAFDAARTAGLPGTFVVFEHAGLRAVLTTAPELGYLNAVSGVSPETVAGLPDILETFGSLGAELPCLVVALSDATVDEQLREWGFAPAGRRPLAWIELPHTSTGAEGDQGRRLTIREPVGRHDLGVFLEALSAGYGPPAAVRTFMAAEHSVDVMRRFVAWRDDQAVAVGAMSVHRGVAVLGGATVVPEERGNGWQLALLRHRLRAAEAAGCHAAVATASPDSASLRNLARAGFTIHDRQGWRSTRS